MDEHKSIIRMSFSVEALDDGNYVINGPFGEDNKRIKKVVRERDHATRIVQEQMDVTISQLK